MSTFVVSCLVVLLSFLWQGNKGFGLGDEGFLWYGIQRVMLGEVPIRDFMAYDPGRYYLTAALLWVTGDNGIMSVRAALAVFQALGLFAGLLLIARTGGGKTRNDTLFRILSAVTLVVWMFPRHKLFDISISVVLIGVLTYLVRNPVPKRYFFSGACIGLIAVFGRNHGLYGAVASLGVMIWLKSYNRSALGVLNGTLIWGAGVAIGFLPVVIMMLLIPGFAPAFWESLRFLFEQKATNLPLQVPWPWTVDFAAASVAESVSRVLIGIFFIGTLLFGGISVAWVIFRGSSEKSVPPALVASAFLALPYAHYAFSRADAGHLAQGIFPLLVGCLVILSTAKARLKWSLAMVLCAASIWGTHAFHPGWQCLADRPCIHVEVTGSELQIDAATAGNIAMLRRLAEDFATDDQQFIATPFWPGAYALLQRKSPMWEIYALFPRSEAFQRKEIERIRASGLGFAIVLTMPLDGREELRFKNTHPLVYQFISENFDPLSGFQTAAHEVYKARDKNE